MFNAELTSQLYSHFKHQQQQQQQQKKRRPQSVTSEEDEEEYEEEELVIDLKESDTATDGEQQSKGNGNGRGEERKYGEDEAFDEGAGARHRNNLNNCLPNKRRSVLYSADEASKSEVAEYEDEYGTDECEEEEEGRDG
jgi:hypothetical protein